MCWWRFCLSKRPAWLLAPWLPPADVRLSLRPGAVILPSLGSLLRRLLMARLRRTLRVLMLLLLLLLLLLRSLSSLRSRSKPLLALLAELHAHCVASLFRCHRQDSVEPRAGSHLGLLMTLRTAAMRPLASSSSVGPAAASAARAFLVCFCACAGTAAAGVGASLPPSSNTSRHTLLRDGNLTAHVIKKASASDAVGRPT